jgi:hypothetical protein
MQRILVGKPGEKVAHGRPTYRWEDNIKMDIKKLNGRLGSGFIWLRVGNSDRLVNRFHKMQSFLHS